MDEQNRNNYGHHRHHGRDRGDRGHGHRHHGGHRGEGGRGRSQRPLLTSAINGAGLSFIALMLVDPVKHGNVLPCIALAVVAFGLSSIISYIAQRSRPIWIEKISDFFFLIGAAILIWEGLHLGGLLSSLGF